MAKRKVRQRKPDYAAIAREAARELVRKIAVLKKLREGEPLDTVGRTKELRLLAEIEELKKEISDLGFDPRAAVSTAAALINKESILPKRAGLKVKPRRRKGGVGMYGLGAAIKSWR